MYAQDRRFLLTVSPVFRMQMQSEARKLFLYNHQIRLEKLQISK